MSQPPPPSYGGQPPYRGQPYGGQPPYGDPNAYYGQQPTRKKVRKGLLITGIVLMVLAPLAFCGGFFATLLPLMDADATVPTDGTTTAVDLPANEERGLFVESSSSWGATSCAVMESSGEPIELRSVSGDVEVNGYSAVQKFDTGSGDLRVTCANGESLFAGSDEVRIGKVPGAGFAVGLVLSFVVPGVLFLIGLVLLIVALVRRRPV